MIEPWLQQVTERFWAAAGGPEAFPRRLERAVLWALPLAIMKLPRLWVCDAKEWLERRGIPCQLGGGQDRPLHGCMIAYAGKGFVLLDGTDPDDESRFSLAHEVAHFLVDYLHPRQLAIHRLGHSIVAVLDGLRPPTVDERIHALLRHTLIGVHTHLMDRRPDGGFGCHRVMEAESRADRLALELLAPIAEVQQRMTSFATTSNFYDGVQRTVGMLISDFGLPRTVADTYGRALYISWQDGLSIREWLGF